MEKNLGKVDRTIRALLALAIFVLFLGTSLLSNIAGFILLFVAAELVLTSGIGICPLYFLFGLNTSRD